MNAHALEDPQFEYRRTTLRCILFVVASCGVVLGIFYPDSGGTLYDGLAGVLALMVALIFLAIDSLWHRLAAWLLIIGGVSAIGLIWYWYPSAGMASALALPVMAGAAVLGLGGSLVGALLASGVLIGASSGTLPLPTEQGALLIPVTMIWASFIITALMVWQQSATVATALQGYREARDSLNQARDRQSELNQALKDLDLAHRELIRLNDLLQAAREAVVASRRAKEEFVANVSHELRTPLNMIIGFSDEILERPGVYGHELPGELLEDIAVIKRNSEQLARLVDDVLDLVEADTGFTRLARESISIGEIVRDAAEAVRPFFERKGLRLTVEAEAGLPHLNCDPTRIRQVVLNLLSNAARFTEQGGADVRSYRNGDNLVVSVTDTGLGMDPAVAQRMFEPFQQADPSLRRRYGGTGLGLSISKRLVELHGGEIWIESQAGVGTTVSFSLPALSSEIMRVPASTRWFSPYHDFSYQIHNQPSTAKIVNSEPSIAVVENGESLAHLLSHYLETWEVTSLPNLDAAAHAVGVGGSRAVVVNDFDFSGGAAPAVNLPHMDLDVPVIYCWAPANEDISTRMGVAAYLVKPVHREDLLRTIAEASPRAERVLVVDDDEDARHLFVQMLTSAQPGYQVAHAQDGVEALSLMRSWRPDVVLLDLLMPNLDGYSVLAARADEEQLRDVPIIIISAKDQRQDPVMTTTLTLTRQGGLSARDLAEVVQALVSALPPRFGSPALPENLVP